MQTTSGPTSASHCSTRCWRTFNELTFHVANRIRRHLDRRSGLGGTRALAPAPRAGAGAASPVLGARLGLAALALAGAFGGGRPAAWPGPSPAALDDGGAVVDRRRRLLRAAPLRSASASAPSRRRVRGDGLGGRRLGRRWPGLLAPAPSWPAPSRRRAGVGGGGGLRRGRLLGRLLRRRRRRRLGRRRGRPRAPARRRSGAGAATASAATAFAAASSPGRLGGVARRTSSVATATQRRPRGRRALDERPGRGLLGRRLGRRPTSARLGAMAGTARSMLRRAGAKLTTTRRHGVAELDAPRGRSAAAGRRAAGAARSRGRRRS